MRWLLASLFVLATTMPALERSEKTLAYQRDQCWPAAVRFLRVDERLKVVEKDAEAGYVLFELKEEGKTFRGSLELMTVQVDGRTAVRFVIQIEDRPSWLEIAMLTRLERKLRSELGSPAPRPSKKRPPAGDKDGDKGGDKGDRDAKEDQGEADKDDKDRDGRHRPQQDPRQPDEGGPPISPTP